jgi:YtxH-like protein
MGTFGRRSNAKQWARLAMKFGLALTDAKLWSALNDQVRDRAEDWGDHVRDKYNVASDRLDDARGALRGETDWATPIASFLGGIGVGVAVGMLFAPVSGEEARAAIRDRARDVSSKVNDKVNEMTGSSSRFQSTGT